MDDWRWIAACGERQHGAVGAWQLGMTELTNSTFYRHARRHGWTQLWPGVWGMPATVDTYERQMAAGRLLARNRAPLTGASALWLVDAIRRRPREVHLWAPPNLHLTGRDRVRYHRGAWVLGDVVMRRRGFPVVPPLRALTDYRAPVAALVEVIAALDRLRLATPGEVAAYLERRGRFVGIVKLRAALAAISTELVHSGAERLARRLTRDAGLRPHPRPLAIVDRNVIVGEIDLPWPRARYGVEVDGPHHLLPTVVAADKARDRRLARLEWMIDRFTSDEIERDPRGFVRQVGAGLTAASARGVAPWPD